MIGIAAHFSGIERAFPVGEQLAGVYQALELDISVGRVPCGLPESVLEGGTAHMQVSRQRVAGELFIQVRLDIVQRLGDLFVIFSSEGASGWLTAAASGARQSRISNSVSSAWASAPE